MRTSSGGKNTGQWTLEERILFREGIRRYSYGKWKAISEVFVTTRTPKQIRDHARTAGEEQAIEEGIDLIAVSIEKDILDPNPSVSWDDVIGVNLAKDFIMQNILLPPRFPEYFKGIRSPYSRVLLYGPQGCGKMLIAKAAATHSSSTFFNFNFALVFNRESFRDIEKVISELFKLAKARAPSIIMLDEIDVLSNFPGTLQRKAKSELIVQLDALKNGYEDKIVILAATNQPWSMDADLRKRFENYVYVPLPDLECREEIFKNSLKSVQIASDVDLTDVAQKTKGCNANDLVTICREASLNGIKRILSGSTMEEIEEMTEEKFTNEPVRMIDLDYALAKKELKVLSEERYLEWSKTV